MVNSESARDSRREPYVLGHSKQELDRLRVQARLIDPITRLFFAEAGVAPGMRVLDVGSGAGDTAFLVAELVGPPDGSLGWIDLQLRSPSRDSAPTSGRCAMSPLLRPILQR
jgi:hypothetical protein